MAEAHSEWLNAKIEEETGKRVTLTDSSVESEERAVAAINTDTGMAFVSKIFDKGDEIRVETHPGEDVKEPVLINSIIGLGLIQADDVSISVSGFR